MVKRLVECPCGKKHWARVTKEKNPLTGKTVRFVMESDKLCQQCKNRMRQGGMKRKVRLRKIPEKFNKEITLRELYQAEGKRRQEEKKTEQKIEKQPKKRGKEKQFKYYCQRCGRGLSNVTHSLTKIKTKSRDTGKIEHGTHCLKCLGELRKKK